MMGRKTNLNTCKDNKIHDKITYYSRNTAWSFISNSVTCHGISVLSLSLQNVNFPGIASYWPLLDAYNRVKKICP